MPPIEETTPQQAEFNRDYHNRNLTLRGMAMANWLREHFEEKTNDWSTDYPQAICYGGATALNFVAVGTAGAMQKSPNGVYWREMTPAAAAAIFNGVAYGNGVYVAVGDNTGPYVEFAAEDLASWAAAATQPTVGILKAVAYGVVGGNPLFVAVGVGGAIATSADGDVWADQTPDGAYSDTFNGVTFGNGLFVAVGNTNEIQTSPDGVNWTARTPDTNVDDFNAVTYGVKEDGTPQYMAVGDPAAGSVGIIQTSPNGIVWTNKTPETPMLDSTLQCVGYGNDVWVVAGEIGELQISYDDGESWIHQPAATSDGFGIAYGNGMFLLVGRDNFTYTGGLAFGSVLRTLKMA